MATSLPVVEVHMSSFGPFLDVKVNPSEAVMHALEHCLPEACDGLATSRGVRVAVVSKDVLHVTPATVKAYITRLAPIAASSRAVEEGRGNTHEVCCRLFVHLGVHRGGQQVKFERVGLNNLHCPRGDADGVVCSNVSIAQSDGDDDAVPPPLSASHAVVVGSMTEDGDAPRSIVQTPVAETYLPEGRSWLTQPVAAFVSAVRRRLGLVVGESEVSSDGLSAAIESVQGATPLPVVSSVDAGAYLCNYTLYQSLRQLTQPPAAQLRACRSLDCVTHVAAQQVSTKRDSSPEAAEVAAEVVPALSLFIHVTDPTFFLTTAHSPEKQALTIALVLRHFVDNILVS